MYSNVLKVKGNIPLGIDNNYIQVHSLKICEFNGKGNKISTPMLKCTYKAFPIIKN